MYVETVPNSNSPPAILLRESFREGKQVRKRTLANISEWPASQVETLRRVLKGETIQFAARRERATDPADGLSALPEAGLEDEDARESASGSTVELGQGPAPGAGNRVHNTRRYTTDGSCHRLFLVSVHGLALHT